MTTSSNAARTVRCPNCGGPSLFTEQNRYRPFCSERCKTQDFGAWASESFRVAAQAGAEEDDPPSAPSASSSQ